jgi:hypothetical protein
VTSSVECITDLQRWESNLFHIRPIWDVPLGRPFDSTIESDASDTGVDAVTYIDCVQRPHSAEAVTLPCSAAQSLRMVANPRPLIPQEAYRVLRVAHHSGEKRALGLR